MNVLTTPINGLLILEPRVFTDERGYFYESYNRQTLQKEGIMHDFVQDNESRSTFGVVRGLHYQLDPHAQTKLVRVTEGAVWDVALDLRHNSPTFGQWFGVELTAGNKRQFLIPKGFAHGFSVLSPSAVFAYKCDNYYTAHAERGILFNDPVLQIDWKIPEKDAIVSEKDKQNPHFANADFNFKI